MAMKAQPRDVRVMAVLALTMIALGCAARAAPPPAAPPAPVADDATAELIRQGCYRCLEQAFEKAQRLGARTQAFEAAGVAP